MSDVKYCPECNAEYYPHIIDCADCGVPLKTPAELSEIRERQEQFEEEDVHRRQLPLGMTEEAGYWSYTRNSSPKGTLLG